MRVQLKAFVTTIALVAATCLSNGLKEGVYINAGSSTIQKGKIKATATCPKMFPLLDEQGYCHSCDEEEVLKLVDKASCEKHCDGKKGTIKRVDTFWGCKLEKCPSSRPLEDNFGKCRTCKYDSPVNDTLNCTQCPNRMLKDGKCVIADCSDRPLLSTDGSCYPCSTALSVSTLSGKCTSVCPNRRESGSWWSTSKDGVRTEGVNCNYGSDGDE